MRSRSGAGKIRLNLSRERSLFVAILQRGHPNPVQRHVGIDGIRVEALPQHQHGLLVRISGGGGKRNVSGQSDITRDLLPDKLKGVRGKPHVLAAAGEGVGSLRSDHIQRSRDARPCLHRHDPRIFPKARLASPTTGSVRRMRKERQLRPGRAKMRLSFRAQKTSSLLRRRNTWVLKPKARPAAMAIRERGSDTSRRENLAVHPNQIGPFLNQGSCCERIHLPR